jgi:hypothetical protein
VKATGGDIFLGGIDFNPDSDTLSGIQTDCDTNEDGTTDLQGADGFYACINEATNTADLYLYGKIKDDSTVSTLALTTKVSARSVATPSPSPSPSP